MVFHVEANLFSSGLFTWCRAWFLQSRPRWNRCKDCFVSWEQGRFQERGGYTWAPSKMCFWPRIKKTKAQSLEHAGSFWRIKKMIPATGPPSLPDLNPIERSMDMMLYVGPAVTTRLVLELSRSNDQGHQSNQSINQSINWPLFQRSNPAGPTLFQEAATGAIYK